MGEVLVCVEGGVERHPVRAVAGGAAVVAGGMAVVALDAAADTRSALIDDVVAVTVVAADVLVLQMLVPRNFCRQIVAQFKIQPPAATELSAATIRSFIGHDRRALLDIDRIVWIHEAQRASERHVF